jgi:hypothetical protein
MIVLDASVVVELLANGTLAEETGSVLEARESRERSQPGAIEFHFEKGTSKIAQAIDPHDHDGRGDLARRERSAGAAAEPASYDFGASEPERDLAGTQQRVLEPGRTFR